MSGNDMLRTKLWLKGLFSDYYSGLDKPPPVSELHRREFGFGSFSKKIVVRHRAFRDQKELDEYLKREAPAHVSHSTARYEFPAAEDMTEKVWLGSDLVFDIDIGDLNLKHQHESGWICEECFTALKEEAYKLIDFLGDDFGFAKDELLVNFSGSRGYHVRIKNEKVLTLDSKARKEICSYLSLDMNLNELIVEHEGMILGPRPDQHGLKGRIAKTVINRIANSEMKNREWVIKQIGEGNWGAFPRGYGLKKVIEYIRDAAVRIPVDSRVTTDLTHLIRMADTLHGGSSLLAKTVSNLDRFNPLSDCFVFNDMETEVEFVMKTPELVAKEQTFGPFEKGRARLPRYLAAYLGAKGRCTVG